jgi:hypothetical protein
MSLNNERFAQAQAALALIYPNIAMTFDRGFVFEWECCGSKFKRRWVASSYGSDFPKWHNQSFCGGTGSRVLTQLMRWVRGQPILPLAFWEQASGPNYLNNPNVYDLVRSFGWLVIVPCVFCQEPIVPGQPYDEFAWKKHRVCGPAHIYVRECALIRHQRWSDGA